MQTFSVDPGGFNQVKRQLLVRSIPVLVIACGAGIYISKTNTNNSATDVNVLPILIPLMAAAMGVGIFTSVKKLRKQFESYQLTITDEYIKRIQVNTATISIKTSEVSKIIKNSKGGFIIKGSNRKDLIIVPAQINNPEQLELVLMEISPITNEDNIQNWRSLQQFAGFGAVALMICVYTVNNKIIVGISGTIVLAIMIWSLIEIRNNKNLDNKTKRNMWMLLLVMASVIGVMYYKLTGQV